MSIKRNGEIDLLRFVFAILILLFHFHLSFDYEHFEYGYSVVAFFFVLSGFLMAKHVYDHENAPANAIPNETWSYLFKKIKSFYIYYFSAVLLQFVVLTVLIKKTGGASLIKNLLRSIPTFSLSFMALNYNKITLYVGNTWYLSALLIACLILYPILLKNKEAATKLFFPLISLFSLGYLYGNYKTVTYWDGFTGFTYGGILEAVAEIALGASLYALCKYLISSNSFIVSGNMFVKILMTCIKLFCYGVCIIYSYGKFFSVSMNGEFTLHVLLFSAIGILLSFSGAGFSIPDCKLTRILGKMSLGIFIYHGFLRHVLETFVTGKTITTGSFAVLALVGIIISVALMYLMDLIVLIVKRVSAKKQ